MFASKITARRPTKNRRLLNRDQITAIIAAIVTAIGTIGAAWVAKDQPSAVEIVIKVAPADDRITPRAVTPAPGPATPQAEASGSWTVW